jgi:response regulator RpfG family c-di-GMP phosphodiesterase
MQERATLLVIDQDPLALQTIHETLASEPLTLLLCETTRSAREVLYKRKIDLIMASLFLGEETSLDLLRQVKLANPEAVIILMTSPQPTLESAVEVLREGVYDYLFKPFNSYTIRGTIQRGLIELRLRRENALLRETIGLYRISDSVGGTIELKKLLGLTLEAALKQFESHLAAVLMWDEKRNRFQLSEIRAKNELPFQTLALDPIGPEVIYLKPQIISTPDEIKKVFPLPEQFRVASLISYPLLGKGRIMGLLYLIRDDTIPPYSSGELESLSILAGRAAAALENSRLYQQLEDAYLSTINALANAVEARDVYTKGHTERVCYLAETLARQLGWSDEQLSHVRMGSILHDIGKIGVPDSILNKPKPLTPAEFEVMKLHPQMGVKILEGIGFLEPALPYVLYHHERYDGKGYPIGLSGEDVPLEGRLMAVVDTFDAITSDRPYRKNLGYQKAIQELIDFSGTQFDPQVAQAMIVAWRQGQIDRQRLEIKISPPVQNLPAEIFSQI